ncbi:YwbE family protein [Bacillus megaterium]|nr:YwbE family protein [Priestia megaterium]
MNGQNRKDVAPGIEVDIVLKADQRSGKLTRGTVKDILTNSNFHPHGIKVRLTDGQVGRIKENLPKLKKHVFYMLF